MLFFSHNAAIFGYRFSQASTNGQVLQEKMTSKPFSFFTWLSFRYLPEISSISTSTFGAFDPIASTFGFSSNWQNAIIRTKTAGMRPNIWTFLIVFSFKIYISLLIKVVRIYSTIIFPVVIFSALSKNLVLEFFKQSL